MGLPEAHGYKWVVVGITPAGEVLLPSLADKYSPRVFVLPGKIKTAYLSAQIRSSDCIRY
jgi:hypothetical protein